MVDVALSVLLSTLCSGSDEQLNTSGGGRLSTVWLLGLETEPGVDVHLGTIVVRGNPEVTYNLRHGMEAMVRLRRATPALRALARSQCPCERECGGWQRCSHPNGRPRNSDWMSRGLRDNRGGDHPMARTQTAALLLRRHTPNGEDHVTDDGRWRDHRGAGPPGHQAHGTAHALIQGLSLRTHPHCRH